jgi:hypothetical protein
VPDDVVTWFANYAPSYIDRVNAGSVSNDALSFPGPTTVGAAVSVYVLSDEFLMAAGNLAVDSLTPPTEWKAAILGQNGAIEGTITAYRTEEGHIEWGMTDDDKLAGLAVSRVQEGSWFATGAGVAFVVSDKTATEYYAEYGEQGFTAGLADLEAAFAKYQKQALAEAAKNGGQPPAGGDPIDLRDYVLNKPTGRTVAPLIVVPTIGALLIGTIVLITVSRRRRV